MRVILLLSCYYKFLYFVFMIDIVFINNWHSGTAFCCFMYANTLRNDNKGIFSHCWLLEMLAKEKYYVNKNMNTWHISLLSIQWCFQIFLLRYALRQFSTSFSRKKPSQKSFWFSSQTSLSSSWTIMFFFDPEKLTFYR